MNYNEIIQEHSTPIKMWTQGVPVEAAAEQQLRNIAALPIIYKHIAVMPDVHLGKGATIGSVIPSYKAIIPAAVGVDLGCGMMACKTTLVAADLPDNLLPLRLAIEQAVPHGREFNRKQRDTGSWGRPPEDVNQAWATLKSEFDVLCVKEPKLANTNNHKH